jgi:hypothetical protein
VSSTPVRTHQPHPQMARTTSFQAGHPGGPGRPRGSRNRMGLDIRQVIVDAAIETGFIKVDDKPYGSGEEGCKGYLKWAALNESPHASGRGD